MQRFFSFKSIPITIPTQSNLVDEVRRRLLRGQGFALATINLNHLVEQRRSQRFAAACAAHDLTVADGNPIVWLSRLAGRNVDLVTGSDNLRPLLSLAAKEGIKVGFYGATLETLELAAEKLKLEIPDLQVVWMASPPMGFDPEGNDARSAIVDMEKAGVQLCIIALSSPRQECFAAHAREVATKIGFCSLGASLDFVVGKQIRAPLWMRKMALEWLWRASSAPKRLGSRYLICLAILPPLVLHAVWTRLVNLHGTQSGPDVAPSEDRAQIPAPLAVLQRDTKSLRVRTARL